MPMNGVSPDEVLYRRVVPGHSQYVVEGQRVRISGQAFYHSSRRTSVDRAQINGNDPSKTKFREEDGVVSFVTEQAAAIQFPHQGIGYLVNVDEDAIPPDAPDLPENPAHAVIYATPQASSSPQQDNKAFKKMIEKLALLQSLRWEVMPADVHAGTG